MRITSTTSVPVRAKETTAAGPAEAMTTPLPTNRPAPITPPSAIMCMCRRCSARHGGPAGVLQIHPLVAPRVEVDVVLLLRAPLLIVEDDHRHADALARARQQLVEADAPRAVAHVGERRTLG